MDTSEQTTPPRAAARRIFAEEMIDELSAPYSLSRSSAHYLTRVLRLEVGASVEVVDGSGRVLQGTIAPDELLTDLRVIYTSTLPARRVLLAGLIKGARWEWLLEKAAELGADDIVPLATRRSVVKIAPNKAESKRARWQKIVEGAARQCERLSRPLVHTPLTVADAITAYADARTLLIDEAEVGARWPRWATDEALVIAVGPEGGFTDAERAAFYAAGATAAGLGPNLLRAETAVAASLMLVRSRDFSVLGD